MCAVRLRTLQHASVAALLLALAVGPDVPGRGQVAPRGDELQELSHDFRGSRPLHLFLKLSGPVQTAVIKHEDGGLRITLPEKRMSNLPIAVAPRFMLCGNFEVTG